MSTQFEIPALYVTGPALAAFAAYAVTRRRRDAPGWSGGRLAARVTAAVYAATVVTLTLFPLWIYTGAYRNRMPWTNQINWIPLLTADVTMAANVVMFVPFGFLLPLFTRCDRARRVALLSALTSLAIECVQLAQYLVFSSGRSVDVNDLVANTLGGLLGFAVLRLALRGERTRGLLRSWARPATVPDRSTAGSAPVG
ncbi:VanZ family protein [Streptomyces sp. NBC_01218]|uniref:VanZ family protein n=1 Tax=unclassified Streptomyces TaxID=2593676 RepID=UPI0023B9D29F|nr:MULTISPECIES: VanZ family protein [unclassified Streptomyces]WEH40287.1 VanZ family protein [Streptomyces sp. AM 2-1-1]WSQ51980.1 VanZ family protein [Streptomyces sp. NBC_01218]